jgi:lipoprotein-releasing system permease protein
MYRAFLAIRYLLARPINLLGVIGIMLGVWALIVVVSIFSGFLKEVGRHLQSSTADMTAISLPDDASFARLAAVIEADPNVAACAPRIIWQGLLHPFGENVGKPPPPAGMSEFGAATPLVSVLGIDPLRERAVTEFDAWLERVTEPGRRIVDPTAPLGALGGSPALVLSQQRMRDEGIRCGDRAKVTMGQLTRGEDGAEQLDFQALELRVAGAYETTYAGFDGLNVFVHIDTLRGLLDSGGAAAPLDHCNEIAIRLRDASRAEETAARVERLLNETAGLRRAPIRVRTWAQANAGQLGNVEHQRSLMKLVLFVIMVVAAFLMYATLSMMVTEKTHDIGILTAMGATRGGVMMVFTGCGVAIAVVGTALGVVAGCVSSVYLDAFNGWMASTFGIDLFPVRIYNLRHVPYDLDPVWITEVSTTALLLGALVAAVPAWRAARYDPLESLRNE